MSAITLRARTTITKSTGRAGWSVAKPASRTGVAVGKACGTRPPVTIGAGGTVSKAFRAARRAVSRWRTGTVQSRRAVSISARRVKARAIGWTRSTRLLAKPPHGFLLAATLQFILAVTAIFLVTLAGFGSISLALFDILPRIALAGVLFRDLAGIFLDTGCVHKDGLTRILLTFGQGAEHHPA